MYPIAWIDIHGCLLKHLYEYSYEFLRGYGYGHRHVHGWQWLKCTIRAGNCLQPVTFTVCCCNLFRMRRQCRVPSFLFVKNRFHRIQLDANLDALVDHTPETSGTAATLYLLRTALFVDRVSRHHTRAVHMISSHLWVRPGDATRETSLHPIPWVNLHPPRKPS